MNVKEMITGLETGKFNQNLKRVYVLDSAVPTQINRYIELLNTFGEMFGWDRDVNIISAPGRTEICGNHTDHNNGKVLAAAINLDAVAVVSKNNENIIRVKSKGHKMNVVDLNDLEPDEKMYGDSTAFVKGVAAGVKDLGFAVGGFDACTVSDVMGGSGLSSSAAFEVLLGSILSYVYNDGNISNVDIAKISQMAENKFFGKPCGLLDQMASSVGTFVTIDFKSTTEPSIKKVDFDFSKSGHSLCVIDTHGNHSDLTDDYAAVRGEMESVAKALGKSVLREVTFEEFFDSLPQLVGNVNDRALLRAIHFFDENKRVDKAVACLESNDFEGFKQAVLDSGHSSFMLNQNVYSPKNPTEQKLSLALAVSKKLLEGKGAWRVHGGGFAGTIQAFVPNDILDEYKAKMESIFGKGSCYVLIIRPVGGAQVI